MSATKSGPVLAFRLSQISSSPTMAVMAEAERLRARGADVVNFSAGEPDFPTPESIKRAGEEAIRSDFTRYTANAGIAELRQAVADRYRADYGFDFTADEVIVTNGGKHALFDLMMALLDPEDEVVIPNPHWMTFSEQVRLLGARPILVETSEEEEFRISVDRIAAAITPRTKIVLVCSPSNPTGTVAEGQDFRALGELAARSGFFLLWDDTYGRLMFEPAPSEELRWLRDNAGDRFLIAGTASKAYAMTGWRLGWALGPKNVIAACAALQSHMTSNASSIAQRAAVAALTMDQDCVRAMVSEYRWRRDRLRQGLLEIPGLTCVEPRGGFYLFPGVARFLDAGAGGATELAGRLLEEEKVAVVPGPAFGRDGHLRVSFATARERIEEGIARVQRFFGRRA